MKATKVCNISAGHQLKLNYDSPCCRQHGHNYRIAVTVETATLNKHGMVCDFALIKKAVYKFDHRLIEEVELDAHEGIEFRHIYGNATAENIAEAVAAEVNDWLEADDGAMGNEDAKVVRVEVGETGGNIVVWEVPE